MSKLQELLDIIEARGGNAEATRKSVLDAAIALGASPGMIAEAMIEVIRDDDQEKITRLIKERKSE